MVPIGFQKCNLQAKIYSRKHERNWVMHKPWDIAARALFLKRLDLIIQGAIKGRDSMNDPQSFTLPGRTKGAALGEDLGVSLNRNNSSMVMSYVPLCSAIFGVFVTFMLFFYLPVMGLSFFSPNPLSWLMISPFNGSKRVEDLPPHLKVDIWFPSLSFEGSSHKTCST